MTSYKNILPKNNAIQFVEFIKVNITWLPGSDEMLSH